MLIALVAVFLYVTFENSRKLDAMSKNLEEVHSLLYDPNRTNIKN